ncbi:hypothetical protein MBLNU230_g8251t1 [Neophaeotheca triangularis]
MAPKKRSTKASAAKSKDEGQPKQEDDPKTDTARAGSEAKQQAPPANDEAKPDADTKTSPSKRKKATKPSSPQKAPRRSGRSATKAQPTRDQLLTYLLTPSASTLCRPADESNDLSTRGPETRTYSTSTLNPFEELLSAVILSRPISHMLGLRTIRTILNAPYDFSSAKKVQDAGSEKRHQAVYDARTQHKDKTAQEMGMIADVVLEMFTTPDDKEGARLQKVRDDCSRDVDAEREMLKSKIKGLGKTGLEIFFRRVQWLWLEAFPFVDERSGRALRKLGLPEEPEDLVKALEGVDVGHLPGEDVAAKRRRAFVTVLERATGADLEGKHDDVAEAAVAA